MRDRGRFTSLQGRILAEELLDRIGEIPGSGEPAVRHPTPPLDDTYREDQPIVEDPTYRPFEDYLREEEEWMRRPLGDT